MHDFWYAVKWEMGHICSISQLSSKASQLVIGVFFKEKDSAFNFHFMSPQTKLMPKLHHITSGQVGLQVFELGEGLNFTHMSSSPQKI